MSSATRPSAARRLLQWHSPAGALTSAHELHGANPLTDQPDVRHWNLVVSEAIRLVVLVLASVNTVVGIAVTARALDISEPVAMTGVALLAGSQGVIWASLWLRRQSLQAAWATLLLVLPGMALSTPYTIPGESDTWWLTSFMITTVVFLIGTSMRFGWQLAGLVILFNFWLRSQFGSHPLVGPSQLSLAAVELGQLTAMALSSYLAFRACIAAADSTDSALAARRQSRASVALSQARSRRADEVDRFVHDEILHTLRTIAMDRSVISADSAVHSAAQLSGLLAREGAREEEDHSDEARALVSRLRTAAREVPLHVTVTGPRTLVVPVEVAQVFASAAREALRNVHRHAGVSRATVAVSLRGLEVTVTITDSGRGFSVESIGGRSDRRGVADSILKRMRDVGGEADLRSAPGRGTRVTLRWQPEQPPAEAVGSLGHGLTPGLLSALALVVAPGIVANLWYPAWLARHLEHPVTVAAASVAVTATGLATLWIVRRQRLPLSATVIVFAVAVAASLANGLALTPDTNSVTFYWLSSGAGYLAATLAIFRGVRSGLLLGGTLCAVAAWTTWQVSPSLGAWLGFVPAIIAPAIIAVVGSLVRRLGDRFTWEIMRAESDMAAATARMIADEEFRRRLHERLQDRRAALTAFLDGVVARGSQGVGPDVQAAAAHLERAVREDLTLGDQVPLSERISRTRAEGWQVTVRCADGLPTQGAHELVRALAQLGPTHLASGHLSISALPWGAEWRLSLLAVGEPALAAAAHWRALGWEVTVIDGEVHAIAQVVDHDQHGDEVAAPPGYADDASVMV